MQILLVEDDTQIAEFIQLSLKQAGYGCFWATDGEMGLFAARHYSFSAIIMDIMIPKINGLDIIRKIRAEGNTTPIIVLSARGSVESKIEGLEAGGDDYLSKPFSIAELLARIQALIRRNDSPSSKTILKIDDLEMNLITHKVTRGNSQIDLQPLEYQLLEYLMRNSGRVVSKNTILQSVWDFSFAPTTNVVEARVCKLREKIDKNYDIKLLHTVRGFGYVLEKRQ